MSTMRQNIFEVPKLLKQIEADKDKIRNIFNKISNSKRIILAGSSSSYHVAQYGVRLLEERGFHAISKTSSDFDTFDLKSSDAVILISVSGIKGDALRISKKAESVGSKLWVITCNHDVKSENIYVVPTGIKKSFINTHSYIGQLATLYFIFNDDSLYDDAEVALGQEDNINRVAKDISNGRNFVFLSAGYGMVVAEQSALKLREVATKIKHSEALSYDELPHGRLFCLGDDKTVFITLEYNTDHTQRLNLTKEVLGEMRCNIINLSLDVNKYKAPIVMQIITYLLADKVAKIHGVDPDNPKNVELIKGILYEKTNKLEKI